jgi:hypothetical protein
MWKLILVVVAIILLFWSSQEHMTNADLISTLKTFGKEGTKKPLKPYASEAPIMGPKAPKVEPAPPKTNKNGDSGSSIYPDIYGPEYQGPPGSKHSKGKTSSTKHTPGKHQSDDTSDETYQFNPDLKKAFPTEGPPQPFLTDFSKFH